MRALFLLMCGCIIGLAGRASAEQVALTVGDTVRIRRDMFCVRPFRFRCMTPVGVGAVLRIDADTVVVATPRSTVSRLLQPQAVPPAIVWTPDRSDMELERSVGWESRWRSSARGLTTGAAIGVGLVASAYILTGPVRWFLSGPDDRDVNARLRRAVPRYAAVGAAVGAVIGAATPRRRWLRVNSRLAAVVGVGPRGSDAVYQVGIVRGF